MELILGLFLWMLIIIAVVKIIKTIVKAIVKGIRALFKSENDAFENQPTSSSAYNCKSKYQNVQVNPYELSSALDDALLWELQHNGKIRAIKLLREKTGYSLADAKTYVENLELCIPAYKHGSEDSRTEDVSSIDGMDGHAFEHYCAQLLRKNGFGDVSVTPGSGDQGVDILATKDGIKYAIQCKNYASSLGNTPIQEVNAGKVFYNCHVGVVMTNSTFTPKATELAKATGVLLWDRKKLQELITASNPVSKTTPQEQKNPSMQAVVPTVQPVAAQTPILQRSVAPEPITPSAIVSASRAVDSALPKDVGAFFANRESASITEVIAGVCINVHVGSANAVNLMLSNFGIDKDDEEPDELALLFDVEAKTARGIPEDVTMVCNAFAGNYKIATEHEYLYKNSFSWKDSLVVYFDKKNIAKRTTRIDIFCKRG